MPKKYRFITKNSYDINIYLSSAFKDYNIPRIEIEPNSPTFINALNTSTNKYYTQFDSCLNTGPNYDLDDVTAGYILCYTQGNKINIDDLVLENVDDDNIKKYTFPKVNHYWMFTRFTNIKSSNAYKLPIVVRAYAIFKKSDSEESTVKYSSNLAIVNPSEEYLN